MNGNSRIIGAVAVGLSTLLVASFFRSANRRHQQRVTKKFTREAVQSWEGEGGTIIAAAPRAAVVDPAYGPLERMGRSVG